jgi:hypothetical protein
MKEKITITEGVWFNSELLQCRVRITLDHTGPGNKHFGVWYEDADESLCVFVGKYASEYEAMHMIEKIAGQKVQWRMAA